MKTANLPLALLGLLSLAGAAQAQASAQMPFLVEETGKSFARLDDAVRSANGGDATIVIAPGSYRDCAVVAQGRVAFRAKVSGSVTFDGGLCEGRATLVLRGADAMVDGIAFQNDHVADGSAAGIRIDHGGLTVTSAAFRNADAGIVAGDDPASTIRIDRSTFSGLGGCAAAGCAPGVAIGRYARLYVTRSRFDRGRGGDYLWSRAAFVSITDNSFDDSRGHQSGTIVDLPAGATGLIARNVMLQGPDKRHQAGFIVIAAEQRANPSAGLAIAGNSATIAPGATYRGSFVIDFSHEALKIGTNTLGHGVAPFETR